MPTAPVRVPPLRAVDVFVKVRVFVAEAGSSDAREQAEDFVRESVESLGPSATVGAEHYVSRVVKMHDLADEAEGHEAVHLPDSLRESLAGTPFAEAKTVRDWLRALADARLAPK